MTDERPCEITVYQRRHGPLLRAERLTFNGQDLIFPEGAELEVRTGGDRPVTQVTLTLFPSKLEFVTV